MRRLSGRERFLLGILAVGAVVALWLVRGEALVSGGPAEGKRPELPEGEPPVVRMDLMARGAARFDPEGRNLFDYYRPPKPPPPPPPPAPPPQTFVRPAPPPPPPAPPARPRAPVPPTPDFKYLGYFGPKERKIGVFEGNDGLMYAQVGESIAEEFELLRFGYDTVELGYRDETFSGQTTEIAMKAD